MNFNFNQFSTFLQDNFTALHLAAMYSREDVVKLLLKQPGIDLYSTGGVSIFRKSIFNVCFKSIFISLYVFFS